MKFNGVEIDTMSRIKDSIKNDYNYECINNSNTSGHKDDLYTKRIGDIEYTIYRDPIDMTHYGCEIYYYKPQSYDIKYSRNYPRFEDCPSKHEDVIEEMKTKFTEIYKGYANYDKFPLI